VSEDDHSITSPADGRNRPRASRSWSTAAAESNGSTAGIMILTDASGASDVDGVGEGASSVHAARDATQSALANDRLYDEPSRRALSARIRTSP